MEQIVLLVLEWNILTPTVNVLVREVSLIQNPVKDFNPHFMSNMIKKVIFHKNLAYMPPSKVRNLQLSHTSFKPSRQKKAHIFVTVLPSKCELFLVTVFETDTLQLHFTLKTIYYSILPKSTV